MQHLSSDGTYHFPKDSKLRPHFDAVVMLTWSNWYTEPRSNRYHYATRFAQELPVLFVQPDSETGETVSERVFGTNIDIVHISANYGPTQTEALNRELNRRRIFRPLLWIYNVFFEDFVQRSNADLKIYHATEDYLSPPDQWAAGDDVVRAPLIRQLRYMDLVVAVSKGVAESYQARGGFEGTSLVLPNGCDFAFWKESKASNYLPPPRGRPVALFQGGINARLDYSLLNALADQMPDWDFWFCGHDASGGPGWEALRRHANVFYLGILQPEDIADAARQSCVGLIPFKQDELIRRSLPLKAYEYAACGLPTVSVPIDALAHDPDVFTIARTPDEFSLAIRQLAEQRTDPEAIARRLAAASYNSYDKHFNTLIDSIVSMNASLEAREKLNILILHEKKNPIKPIMTDDMWLIERYSYHNIFSFPLELLNVHEPGHECGGYFDAFDAILLLNFSLDALDSPRSVHAKKLISEAGTLKIAVVRSGVLSESDIEEIGAQLGIDAFCVPKGPTWAVADRIEGHDSPFRDRTTPRGSTTVAPMEPAEIGTEHHKPLNRSSPDTGLLKALDRYLAARLGRKSRAHLIRVPILVSKGRSSDFQPLPVPGASSWHPSIQSEVSCAAQDEPAENAPRPAPVMPDKEAGIIEASAPPQGNLQTAGQAVHLVAQPYGLRVRGLVKRALRPVWRLLPPPLKPRLITLYRLAAKANSTPPLR